MNYLLNHVKFLKIQLMIIKFLFLKINGINIGYITEYKIKDYQYRNQKTGELKKIKLILTVLVNLFKVKIEME